MLLKSSIHSRARPTSNPGTSFGELGFPNLEERNATQPLPDDLATLPLELALSMPLELPIGFIAPGHLPRAPSGGGQP